MCKEMLRPFWLVRPQNSLAKQIDISIVKHGRDKLSNKDHASLVKTNAWKPLFKKRKTVH